MHGGVKTLVYSIYFMNPIKSMHGYYLHTNLCGMNWLECTKGHSTVTSSYMQYTVTKLYYLFVFVAELAHCSTVEYP